MSEPVPTTNKPASDAVAALNRAINYGVLAGMAALEAAEPVLTMPVVKQLFEAVCKVIVGFIFKPFLDTFTGKAIVDFQEYLALKAAVAAQHALDLAAKSGDVNAQAQAQALLDLAVAKAAQYVGAVRPSQ